MAEAVNRTLYYTIFNDSKQENEALAARILVYSANTGIVCISMTVYRSMLVFFWNDTFSKFSKNKLLLFFAENLRKKGAYLPAIKPSVIRHRPLSFHTALCMRHSPLVIPCLTRNLSLHSVIETLSAVSKLCHNSYTGKNLSYNQHSLVSLRTTLEVRNISFQNELSAPSQNKAFGQSIDSPENLLSNLENDHIQSKNCRVRILLLC